MPLCSCNVFPWRSTGKRSCVSAALPSSPLPLPPPSLPSPACVWGVGGVHFLVRGVVPAPVLGPSSSSSASSPIPPLFLLLSSSLTSSFLLLPSLRWVPRPLLSTGVSLFICSWSGGSSSQAQIFHTSDWGVLGHAWPCWPQGPTVLWLRVPNGLRHQGFLYYFETFGPTEFP